jgi:uncharacterized surface protein with fasciclin (FAS1) repeats
MFSKSSLLRVFLVLAIATSLMVLPAAAQEAPAADIVDTAVAAGDFTTLVAAVQAAGLVDALKGPGPFTVFAPTDAAFAALPAGTVEALLQDIPALTEILLYHVIPGKVMAADVSDGLMAATLQGSKVDFSVSAGSVKINDANIVATDIEASNGVIHVIDQVILPPSNGFVGIADGATVSGSVEVQAVADDADFLKWQLDVLPFENADTPIFIAVGSDALPVAGTLTTIDTTAFPNGTHALRLRVVRSDSNYDEFFVTFTIDN